MLLYLATEGSEEGPNPVVPVLGEIIIGRPYQGPSGGRVIPLDVARRRYGNSPCLSGSGTAPRSAIGRTARTGS